MVEVVGWFAYGAEDGDEDCAGADEEGSYYGVSGKRFAEDEGCKEGVEDESGLGDYQCILLEDFGLRAYCLQRRKHRQWKGGDLDGASNDIGDHKHEHAQLYVVRIDILLNFSTTISYLPSSPSMRRPAHIVRPLLVLENVRFPL